jgi:RimJ/RimL family protein N-acetyltransferase
MAKISTRYATISDVEALSAVITKVIQNIPYYNNVAIREETLKYQPGNLEQKIYEDESSVLVATVDNDIAGFCLSRFDDYVIWLEWFGITEAYRGKGISKLLLTKLEQTVTPRKCHKIWCDCRTDNKASIHILSANGYTQLVTIPNHWYQQDFILWQKVL